MVKKIITAVFLVLIMSGGLYSQTRPSYYQLQDVPYEDVTKYGAVGNGVKNDTAAFIAAMASGKGILVPPGTYFVKDISVTSAQRIQGFPHATIISDGNIFNITSTSGALSVSNINFGCSSNTSAIIDITASGDIAASRFTNVYFGVPVNGGYPKHHILQTTTSAIVAWTFIDCHFNGAIESAVKFNNAWVPRFTSCYFAWNKKGIEIDGSANTLSIISSVIEQQNEVGILLNIPAGRECYGFAIRDTHFEKNGNVTATSSIVINTTSNSRLWGVDISGCTSFVPTATYSLYISGSGNMRGRIAGNDSRFTYNTWAGSGDSLPTYYTSPNKSLLRSKGTLQGNGAVQATQAIATNSSHLVSITDTTGTGVRQLFFVAADASGSVEVSTIVDDRNSSNLGCTISTGTPNVYQIINKSGMSAGFKPVMFINSL